MRTANTFLGSLLWVDFVRLLGMQKAGGGDADDAADAKKKGAKGAQKRKLAAKAA